MRCNLWPHGHMISHDKLKTKYLIFCKADGHQIWQSGDLWWEKLTHNVNWPSDYMITWSHVTNWKLNISLSAKSMTTKYDRWGLMIRGIHLWSHMILWQRGDVWSRDRLKCNIFSLASLMPMKLCKLVTYGEVKALMKSHVPLTTWSCHMRSHDKLNTK